MTLPQPIQSRPFGVADDALLLTHIVAAVAATSRQCSYWHVGDIWWGLYQISRFDPTDNVRLWFAGETPVAFGWYYPSGGVSGLVAPGHPQAEALEEEILAWAEGRRREMTASSDGAFRLTATAFEHDAARIAFLTARGYTRVGTPMLHFYQPLPAALPAMPVPPGAQVRSVLGEREWAERVEIHREVWHPSKVTLDAYRRLRDYPGYSPDLDLVAVLPDGRFSSYCLCWLDRTNRTGEFEPVGTRPSLRRQGWSRAVLQEGLSRLAAHGATGAIVYTPAANTPAVALYQSVGFGVVGAEHDYSKDL